MNRSGCKNCPVKPCETLYRGSICLSRRHKLGLGDPMTNADRIRSMSDEELAELIDRETDSCAPTGDCEKMSRDCKACWLDWLQMPAGEEDKHEP